MCETNPRQSFSRRICDDLSQEILQYLSIEDKVKLEFVSKQFQRTIYEKQLDLYIADDRKGRVKSLQGFMFEGSVCLDWIAFVTLLKKCRNIQTVVSFPLFYGKPLTFGKIVSHLTKYCSHLKRLFLDNFEIDDKIFNKFIKKFGSKLVSVHFSYCLNTISHFEVLKFFPNIEDLYIGVTSDNIPFILEIEIKNLNKLFIYFLPDNFISEESLLSVIKHFAKFSLKSLDIECIGDMEYDCKSILNQISEFKDLIHLTFNSRSYSQQSVDSWKKVIQNCTHLKSLKTHFYISFEDYLDIREMFEILKYFKRLKIIMKTNTLENNVIADLNWFNLQELEQHSNISHLSLDFYWIQPLNENILTKIDTIFPRLQYLNITPLITTEPNGSSQMADILSRLSRLESIKLKVDNHFVCNQIKAKLIEKCRKIRDIDIKVIINV